ncbi:S-adenosyl-L-methionine-dependent methyltransferase [Dactylonectria macrodidyma]|uniref:S-adenosyl-L-methionine-dependent methyltransferase n=1 Tax=Dactylonectria macrodidyma TaxID=307937 RepID=A0A9P9E693_9HYPO|nr:S-adenosyl-L-methionine-dependent methyltransferase [Dactylonectria macrodidyma]
MAAPQDPIELDPNASAPEGDDDSITDAQSRLSSTASITSSLLVYRHFRGRSLPNGDKHIEGFDVSHQWITMMLGDRLYLPPIGANPQHILDIGTGTGIRAIDIADEFPSAEVIGTDISPTQPRWVPPNLEFQIDDAQQGWTFEPESFDFIHVRYMQGSIDDWTKLDKQMDKFLKPGGWFQHIEPEIALQSDNSEIEVGDNHTGFTDITHKKFKVSYGTWPKDKQLRDWGQYTAFYLDPSLDGFAIYPIDQILGWSLEEVEVLVAKMRSGVRNPKNMVFGNVHAVYGRKP